MGTQRCTCTARAGDSYYCQRHGGNGSWAALLKAAAEGLTHCYDPDVARQVETAVRSLPPDHGLREQVEALLTEARPHQN